MRKNLRGHSDRDALGTLGQQEREAHGKLRGFLVTSVVGCHPVGDFWIEHNLFGELGKSGLDVPWGGVAVAGEDVSPVTLTVDQQAFLPQLDKGSEN